MYLKVTNLDMERQSIPKKKRTTDEDEETETGWPLGSLWREKEPQISEFRMTNVRL
jgi:hypothetical protein